MFKYVLAVAFGVIITPYVQPKSTIIKIFLTILQWGG